MKKILKWLLITIAFFILIVLLILIAITEPLLDKENATNTHNYSCNQLSNI